MAPSLRSCYHALANLIGPGMEPFEVIERAEQHRRYWQPGKVRVVLLAESHVYTAAQELLVSLRPDSLLPSGLPRGYVRLVYCLGYGEDGLLGPGKLASRNSGTPQFWKIFFSCLRAVSRNEDFAPIQVSRMPMPDRLLNKIRLLERLREQGIWLVDASLAALYLPGRPKPLPDQIERALTTSWDHYTGQVVVEASPKAILVIGKGVAKVLARQLDGLRIPWGVVPQPNSRLSSEEHFRVFADYYRVCRDPKDVSKLGRR